MFAAWLSLLLPAVGIDAGADRIGQRIDDFTLRDPQGQVHRLSDWSERKLIVVIFLGVDCPLAKLYGPRLVELARTYEGRGVAFVGIHANHHESLSALGRYGRELRIPFPLLRDVNGVLVDRFGARRTPEVFILDGKRTIRYRGRIDDQNDVGIQRPAARRHALVEALEELLAGKPVSQPVTEAVGCLISRAPPPGKGSVTYTRHVAPLLQNCCQECHRPGQIAPFALTTYQEAAGWAPMIREVLEQGRMPPWNADPRHGRFANDPSLSAGEKKILLAWLDADCPEGDPADLPPPRRFNEGWNIPGPDLVVTIPKPFTVPAEGVIEYQYFEVDPGFTEDRWVQAAEVRPGNRAVVHHCNIFLKPPGADGPAEQGTLGSFALTATALGTPSMVLPPGMAKRIPAGWRILFVVHYVAVGSEQTDQTALGLTFADPRTVRQEVATKVMLDANLAIPPREANYPVSQTWQINDDVLLLSLFPHMHLRGKSFRYELLHPGGEVEVLLDVPRFDFRWQHRYVLAEPRRLPAGTRLRCSAVYDNSPANPANPDPSATVRTGPQSWDEMFNGYFDVVLDDQDLTRPAPWHVTLRSATRSIFRPEVCVLLVLAGGLCLVRQRLKRGSSQEGQEREGKIEPAHPGP
jgi:peroxiredoxin